MAEFSRILESGEARKCLRDGGLDSLIFGEGTYQVGIRIGRDLFWPFLRLDDSGNVLEGFCSCQEKAPCVHMAAAYLAIMDGKQEPLHKRFHDSFWNGICRIASDKHGYRVDTLEKKEEGEFEAYSLSGKSIFSIKLLSEVGRERWEEIAYDRPVQTEENSLKFSHLSEKELSLWRQGKPGPKLSYDLSFWSDLAKWLFSLQEAGAEYRVRFSPEDRLPDWVEVVFKDVACGVALEPKDLVALLPTLKTVDTSLAVFDAQDLSIKTLRYHEAECKFTWECDRSLEHGWGKEGIALGEWIFVPGKGFFHQALDPIFDSLEVEKERVGWFLTRYSSFLQKNLDVPVERKPCRVQMDLYFDKHRALHVGLFLFAKGDLEGKGACLFDGWVYLPKKGFFSILSIPFSESHIVVPVQEVEAFLRTHKEILPEGFSVHSTCIVPKVSYTVDREGNLLFKPFLEEEQMVDLGERVYVKGKGLFLKQGSDLFKKELRVERDLVDAFIQEREKQLEGVAQFFCETNPIEKVEFALRYAKDQMWQEPVFTLKPEYKGRGLVFYGEYVYVPNEGFSPVNIHPPFLKQYLDKKIFGVGQEEEFFLYIRPIESWVGEKDVALQSVKDLKLHLSHMQQDTDAISWALELGYRSEIGEVRVGDIWQALKKGQKFLCSTAGLLDLGQERFGWIDSLIKKKWSKGGKILHLTPLEWIRLQTAEEILIPEGSKDRERILDAVDAFANFKGTLPLDIGALKSELRNYQKTGVQWLWFLYGYGLSGLLCDEMGLGKTHQAMALMAAAMHVRKKPMPFLVICPTSVIYHWEELLKTFLPTLKVYVFHGNNRLLDPSQPFDLLLTSYGMARSEKKRLSAMSFDIAVYDEVQNAKNVRSQLHKALKTFKARMVLGLTGTPIENRLMELKALMDLVLPRYLPDDAVFKAQFITPIEKERNAEKSALLAKIIHPFILRRKKSEVLLELPAKTEEIAYCRLAEEQKKLYEETFLRYREQVLLEFQEGRGMHVFALFSKLKQICNHPALLAEDIIDFPEHHSGKWDLFIELLAEARESGQKVVVFSQYLRMLDIIKLYLTHHKIGFAEIRGSTRDRGSLLKKFREDPKCEVFLGSLQAAGTGIELTAASVVIHYDRWWNPAKENQATDRVHRIGQSRGVQVFKLVTKETLEEDIHEMILKKKSLLEDVVGFDDQQVVKTLSKKEIYALFASLEKRM